MTQNIATGSTNIGTNNHGPKPCHLIVLSHGLWGTLDHFTYLADTLQSTLALKHPTTNFAFYKTKSNEKFKTYDGIDLCGSRVCDEIIHETARLLQKDNMLVTKFSLIGYSLGGLIARYAIGVLAHKKYFDTIEPINFVTFCSPHVGVLTPGSSISIKVFNNFVPYLLGKSGKQMFLKDSIKVSSSENLPLLKLMANKNSIFFIGLQKFKFRSLYSNIRSDIRTSWWTSGISYINPFEILDKNPSISIDDNGFMNFLNGTQFQLSFIKDYNPIILDVNNQIKFSGLIDYESESKKKHKNPDNEGFSQTKEEIPFIQNWFKRKFKWVILIFNTFIYIPMWVCWFLLFSILQVSTSFYRVAKESPGLTDVCYLVDQVVSNAYPIKSASTTPLLRPVLSRSLSENYTNELNKLENDLHDQGDFFLDSVFDAITSSNDVNGSIFNQEYQGSQTLTTSLNELCSIPIDSVVNWESDYKLISKNKSKAFEYYQVLKSFKMNMSLIQRDIIASLNDLNWSKYPIYIKKTNATHAAAIVRHEDENFEEGKFVVDHFCNNAFKIN